MLALTDVSWCFGDLYLWWHQDMEAFCVLLALCEGNPLVTGGFPSWRQSFGVLFDASLHKLLNKQPDCWWFEVSWHSGDITAHKANDHCLCSYVDMERHDENGYIQSSAVITRSNIIRYCMNDCRNFGWISIRCWIHKRRLIHCPNGWAMGWLFWIFFRKLTALYQHSTVCKKNSCIYPCRLKYINDNCYVMW